MDKPSGAGWVKVASVTPGGKPYFWFRVIDGRRQWYVWERSLCQWAYSFDTQKGA